MPDPNSSIVQLIKSKISHILSALLILIGILAVMLLVLAWAPDPIIKYTVLALFAVVVVFILVIYAVFAKKNPRLLNSEEHQYQMEQLYLGSPQRQISDTGRMVVDVEAELTGGNQTPEGNN